MLRKTIIGFVLLFAAVILFQMYKGTTEAVATQAQAAQVAASSRPADLQHLKRLAIRTACTKNSDWAMDVCQTMDEKKVMIGMTADQVLLAWGKPTAVNVTTTANRQHEQWIYGTTSPREYLYLDNDVLKSMQHSR